MHNECGVIDTSESIKIYGDYTFGYSTVFLCDWVHLKMLAKQALVDEIFETALGN